MSQPNRQKVKNMSGTVFDMYIVKLININDMTTKFNKINEMLKNTTDHSINNVSKLMLESGFNLNDTFVAVCDEENETYIGIYPNHSLAELEVSTLGCNYHIEGTKRLLKDDDFCDEYYWEIKY